MKRTPSAGLALVLVAALPACGPSYSKADAALDADAGALPAADVTADLGAGADAPFDVLANEVPTQADGGAGEVAAPRDAPDMDVVCPDRQLRCGNDCVASNEANCGACGAACAPGEACVSDRCVARPDAGAADVAVDVPPDVAPSTDLGGAVDAPALDAPSDVTDAASDAQAAIDRPDAVDGGALSDVADVTDAPCPTSCPEGWSCVAGACRVNCLSPATNCSNACRDLGGDVVNCGACGARCNVPSNSVVSCVAGACAVSCNEGFAASGGLCPPTSRAAPRPLAPLSGSRVTTRRPTLRWMPATGADATRVERCADRACASVIDAVTVAGSSYTPDADLPSGTEWWRLTGLSGGAAVTPASAAWAIRVPQASRPFSSTLGSFRPDVNGDGYDDLLVGAVAQDRVFVYLGGASGVGAAPSATLVGPTAGAGFGNNVSAVGDLNGDGFVDVAVSTSARVHYVYFGGPSGLPASPSATVASRATGSSWVLAGAGDVNGDGYGDLLVAGAGSFDLYYGGRTGPTPARVVTVYGPPNWSRQTWDSNFGNRVAGAGDVDGDGFADVIARVPGGAAVYGGAPTGLRVTPVTSFLLSDDANIEVVVAGAGDVNGDGYADVVAGSRNAARVEVHLGGGGGVSTSAAAVLTPPPGAVNFAFTLALVDDVEGDGYDDLAVTAMQSMTWLYYRGAASGPPASPTRTFTMSAGFYGLPLSGAGDLNGDGFFDVAVGASIATRAYVFHGGASGLGASPAQTLLPPSGVTSFGSSLARWLLRPARHGDTSDGA